MQQDRIEIPCPRCGKQRDYSHLPDVIEGEWQSLLPELEASPCQACVEREILESLRFFVCIDPPIPVRWQMPLRRRR